jgi:peptidoglycan L-alanyl-D-glutamate endopeptidase CwlK
MPSNSTEDLDPVVRAIAIEHERLVKAVGIDCEIRHTRRTILEHDAYWAQGREGVAKIKALRKMAGLYILPHREYTKKVTWVLITIHLYDCAWHLVLKRAGKLCWDVDADINENGITDYEEMTRIGEKLGLTCGGRWTKLDWVHYQYTAGFTTDELKQGRRPVQIMKVPTYRESQTQEAI